jgi:hypothetical protein
MEMLPQKYFHSQRGKTVEVAALDSCIELRGFDSYINGNVVIERAVH